MIKFPNSGKKTLDEIEQFLPEAKIGKIQQDTVDIDDKDIVLGMLQSLSMKDYDLDAFNTFDFVLILPDV